MSGTAAGTGATLLGAGLLLSVAALGQASATAAQASGAADLAALSAADARRGVGVPWRGAADLGAEDGAPADGADPCALGRRTAERNGAEQTACRLRPDGSVEVEVRVRRGALPPSTASAVAGPPVPTVKGPG